MRRSAFVCRHCSSSCALSSDHGTNRVHSLSASPYIPTLVRIAAFFCIPLSTAAALDSPPVGAGVSANPAEYKMKLTRFVTGFRRNTLCFHPISATIPNEALDFPPSVYHLPTLNEPSDGFSCCLTAPSATSSDLKPLKSSNHCSLTSVSP